VYSNLTNGKEAGKTIRRQIIIVRRERERESQVVKRETSDEIMERSEKDYLGDEKGERDMGVGIDH
jgi:hypothetical protein